MTAVELGATIGRRPPDPVRRSEAELRDLAEHAALELEEAPAQDVVRWAATTFPGRFAVTSSMADAVLVDVVSRAAPGTPVLFIDTGYHFAETTGTRDAVAAVHDVEVVTLHPERTVAGQDAAYGPRLYERDPDLCCALRKVAPLERGLAAYDAWGSGLRREESPTRAGTPVVGWDARRGKVKVNPLARWTGRDVDTYIAEHGVLLNPLLQDGYSSVGCAPCTRRTQAGEDARAGRWAGRVKTECGLHD